MVGRDLREGERVQRLLSFGRAAALVGVCGSPRDARAAVKAHGAPDVLLVEDRPWPSSEAEALDDLRELCASRRGKRTGLILSRRAEELRSGPRAPEGVPVVERPYRLDELFDALQIALQRARA